MRLSPISVYNLARHNTRAAFDWHEWYSQRQSSLNTYIMQMTQTYLAPWNILLPSPSMFQGLTIYSINNCPWSANSSLNYRFSFLPLSIEYLLKERLRIEKNILCQCTKVKFYKIIMCNYLWCSTAGRPNILSMIIYVVSMSVVIALAYISSGGLDLNIHCWQRIFLCWI